MDNSIYNTYILWVLNDHLGCFILAGCEFSYNISDNLLKALSYACNNSKYTLVLNGNSKNDVLLFVKHILDNYGNIFPESFIVNSEELFFLDKKTTTLYDKIAKKYKRYKL